MLIGISGKSQNGKDTVAKIIQYYLDPFLQNVGKFEQFNNHQKIPTSITDIKRFAGKLKECASLILNIPVKDLESQDVKNSNLPPCWNDKNGNPKTVRQFLQELGTECGRSIHSNFWINALFSDYVPNVSSWIIPDVRFVNEANSILDNNGLLIRVNRDIKTPINSTHESEINLDDFSHFHAIIDNNGTIDELELKIKEILRKHKII